MYFSILHGSLGPLTLLLLLATLVQVSIQMNPEDNSSQQYDSDTLIAPSQSTNRNFLSTLRNAFTRPNRYRAVVNSEPSLDPASKVRCFLVPNKAFASTGAQIYVTVNEVLPGPPQFQPFAAYGKKSYWFLNTEQGFEIRIIPEIGLSWANLCAWWDMELRHSVLNIARQCVSQSGLGGRQSWNWHHSDTSMNPNTQIAVEIHRVKSDQLDTSNRRLCSLCP